VPILQNSLLKRPLISMSSFRKAHGPVAVPTL
jgi:hypothetical protein